MSTRYNTGNPIESTDVRDMSDNAKNFDLFSLSGNDTFTDRFGINRKTIDGVIRSVGIPIIGNFTTGCTVTDSNQGVQEVGGSVYRWKGVLPKLVPPSSTPSGTGGISPSGDWVDVGDASAYFRLKNELIQPNGVSLVGGAVDLDTLSGSGGALIVGTTNGFSVQDHINKSGSILSFDGVVADGITDDTTAVQAALDAGLPIHIPSGVTVKVTSVTISKRGSAIYGPGILIGQIIVAMPQVGDPYQSIIAISRISGVKFIGNTEPIVLRRGRGILIDGNTFDDITSSAVVVRPLPTDFDGANHCVEDVNICNNICSFVDRLLMIDTSNIATQLVPNWWLGNGDIHVFNNIVRVARILHIDADRVDGLSVKGNTFLHFGSGVATKTHCVRVSTKGSQVIISGNEFFEPGLSAIRLVEVENFNINGNNFIDCGQLVPSSAIEVIYILQAPNITFSAKGTIYGNSINGTTAHAVLLSNVSNVTTFGNIVRLNASPVYYSASPLPPFADRYGVYTEQSGTSTNILVENNLVTDAKTRQYNAFSPVGLTDAGTTRYDLSTTATSISAQYEQVNLVQPSATTITSVIGGFEGRVLRLITFNGNTTIANNATIKTGTGANKLLPTDSVHTLTNYGGIWYLK